jgi:chromosome segregation ATPase
MADEIKKVIEVDVSGALDSLDDLRDEVVSAGYSFKSLGDAKKYIDALKASLIDLDETSDEYAERVEEIDKVQEKLNTAMKATGSRLKDAEGSYNALSKQMSELKKQFKATNDEAERNALAKQIVGINDQLKTMDASIGNFQRNVGNYEAAFTKGLSGITKEIEALGNPLAIAKNGVIALGNAFKALIANPVGAVIMAIVVAIKALKRDLTKVRRPPTV